MTMWGPPLLLLAALILQFSTAQENPFCTIGLRQSPIDIETDECVPQNYKRDLSWKRSCSDLEIRNTGSRPEIQYTGTGTSLPAIRYGPLRNKYIFDQAHFHWGETVEEGSEHSINGNLAAAEYHVIYRNEKYDTNDEARLNVDGLVQVAVLLKLSATDNPRLNYVFDGVREVSGDPGGDPQALDKRALDFAFDAYSRTEYYNYEGSSQCDEVVTSIVMKKQVPISADQVAIFREMIDVNGDPILTRRRAVQPLNGRAVFTPGCGCCN